MDWLQQINTPAIGQGGAPVAVLDFAAKTLAWNPQYQMTGLGMLQSYVYEYDFAVDGGAQGTIVLRNPGQTVGQVGTPLPPGFIVTQAMLDVITLLGGGTATVALATPQSAGDLVAGTAVSGAPYSTTGIKATVPVGTAATAIKLTAQRSPTAVIAVANVTSGKLRLIIQGYQSTIS